MEIFNIDLECSLFCSSVTRIIRPHRLCVCLSVGYVRELCKNGWTDRDAVWGLTRVGPRNEVLDSGRDTHRKKHFLGLSGTLKILGVFAAVHAAKLIIHPL